MKSRRITRLLAGLLLIVGIFFIWQGLRTEHSAVPVSEHPAAVNQASRAVEPDSASPLAAERIQVFSDPDLAPLWTVKYGAEFWRRTTPEPAAEPTTTTTTALVNPPFNLGDVIERVDHALTADPDTGMPRLDAGNYSASFDGRGLRFSPARVVEVQPGTTIADSAHRHERNADGNLSAIKTEPDPATEILFRTVSVQRDGESFFSTDRDSANWSIVGNTAQGLLSADWGVVEHYEEDRDGVAVSWVFPQPLPGTGPIEVVASVEGLSYAGETGNAQHFADKNGVARVRIGEAIAVDAAGTRWQLAVHVAPDQSGKLIVQLPSEIQSEAVYPLVIDPVIGPEFGLDQPVSSNASGNQANAAVASAAGAYLVVWEDNRNNNGTGIDIYGTRVSAAGVALNPLGLPISTAPGDQTAPAVAASGTTFLVVWHDQRLGGDNIFGARVTTAGVVSDPSGLPICVAPDGEFNPALAGAPSGFLVAWEDDRNAGPNGTDIYGTRVTTAGVVLDTAGIAISTNVADQLTPTVATNSTGFLVAWQDNRNNGTTGNDIFGARVSSGGVVLDPAGVAISTVINNQTEPAAAANGNTVLLVWRDRRNSGTTSDDIYGTLLNFTNNTLNVIDTNGVAISTDSASQRSPAVCALTNTFLVVWRDRRNSGTTGDDIYGARVDLNGVVLDTNGLPICTNVANQIAPAVANTPSGALVVWTDPRNSLTGNDIYGVRISGTGALLNTNDLAISLAGAAELVPAVAFNGTNYLVAWQDQRNFATNDTDIRAARVSSAGKVVDVTGIQVCTLPSSQRRPAVGASGGEFLVAWEDDRNVLTSGVDIYGTRISGGGAVLDPAGLALSTAANDEATPVVAGNATTFYVVWVDNRNGSAPDIYGTRVSQGGIISDPLGQVISARAQQEIHPALAADADAFLVVWENTGNNDIFASRVTTAGVVLDPSGSSIQLAGQGSESFPSVAALGTNFLVAWIDDRNFSSDIYAARVFGDGSVPDFDGFPVCTLPNNQINPAVAANADTWLVVWQNQGPNDIGNDLFSARVSAAGVVQDFLSVPLVGAGDRETPRLAFGGAGKFLLVNQGFRSNSQRVAANLISADPATTAALIQFKSATFAVLENGKFAKVTVSVTGKFSGVVTVNFATSDGTALAGRDYLPVADRLVFANKKISAVVSIPIIDDLVPEANKTVTLTLQNPTGGALLGTRHTATLTITE